MAATCKLVLCRPSWGTRLGFTRFCTGLQRKMTKEERHELAEYRRSVTKLRKEFRAEWMAKEEMKEQESSVEAAEVAAAEKRVVEEAIENNQKEVERMKLWREEKLAKLSQISEEKQKKSEIVRLKHEAKNLNKKTIEFKDFMKDSEQFITMDNLDSKMDEAIDREINYNFALNISGYKITSIK